jgi:hypothetical protein
VKPELGIHERGEYFNSGVLLIDTSKWIQQQTTQSAVNFARANPNLLEYGDQDSLNFVLRGAWKKLDTKWNVLNSELPNACSWVQCLKALESVKILHFAHGKPWLMSATTRYRKLWWGYYWGSRPPLGQVFPLRGGSFWALRKAIYRARLEFYLDYPRLSAPFAAMERILRTALRDRRERQDHESVGVRQGPRD